MLILSLSRLPTPTLPGVVFTNQRPPLPKQSWQLRHYKQSRQIHKLQQRQLEYCQAADEEAARLAREQQSTTTATTEEPHPDQDIGVRVSVMDFAWEHGPRLLGGVDTEREREELGDPGDPPLGADLEALWLEDMMRREAMAEEGEE